MKELSRNTGRLKESIFSVMTAEAIKNQAINLSQGFPDFDAEPWLLELAQANLKRGLNQYAPMAGLKTLRAALETSYKNLYDLSYDQDKEITVTTGATEAIFCTIMGLINPGDEVLMLAPFYDSYCASVIMAGGTPVEVHLDYSQSGHQFVLDMAKLEQAITPKTKLLILNNPHNPIGKAYTKDELTQIAGLCLKHDLYVLSDEVYEFLVYDGQAHIPMAGLEGMKERTITISSSGKTFGVTGWKVGWALAPEKITKSLRSVHEYNVFSVNTFIQETVANAIATLPNLKQQIKKDYQAKRDFVFGELQKLKLNPVKASGTYFIVCPIDQLKKNGESDIDFCMGLIREKKVATIPLSPFYLKGAEHAFIRFCFAKKDETLRAGMKNLHS